MSSCDADHALVDWFGGGLEKSMLAIKVARSAGGSGTFLGRPFFGLTASFTCDPGSTSLISLRCLISYMGSPETL